MSASGGPGTYFKLGMTVLVITIVVLSIWFGLVSGVGSAYAKYGADRTNATSMFYVFPKWIQPNKKWHDWVGYPENFSNIAGFVPTISTPIPQNSKMKDVTDDTECMLSCAAESKCKGFLYSNFSNTCTLYSSIGTLFPTETSNVIYSVVGSETTSMYTKNTGKFPAPFPIYTITNGKTMGITDFELTSLVCGSGSCTGTTAAPHGLTISSNATIYNYGTIALGTTSTVPYTVTPGTLLVPSSTTFTFPSTYTGVGPTTTMVNTAPVASVAADSILFNTTGAHGYSVGNIVKTTGLAGVFSNSFTIQSVPSATSFVVNLLPNAPLGTTSTGGSVSLSYTLQPFVTTGGALQCATACSSNTTCVAFAFDTSALLCNQITNLNPAPLIAATPTTNDLYTTSTPAFTASSEYWK